MDNRKAVIVVLRRNVDELTRNQVEALKVSFQGRELEFVRTDPKDYLEHDEDCKRLNPDAVILPLERPIPSTAMERGIPHVVFGPDYDVCILELLPLTPRFKPFVAKAKK